MNSPSTILQNKCLVISDDSSVSQIYEPLVVNDLFCSVDQHNQLNCILSNSNALTLCNLSINFLYLNIRSLPSNYLELEVLAHKINFPSFILVSETWLNESNAELYNIDSY